MTALCRGIKSIGGWRRPVKKTASFLLALLLTVLLAIPLAPAAFAEEGSELIEITKPPYGETVTEGDDATFISRAEGYQGLVWQIVSPDGETVWEGEEAIDAFPGLEMGGIEVEELQLLSIPYSMNGCFVRTKFIDRNGNYVLTEPAEITVQQGEIPSPSITPKSAGARLVTGESKTLSVEAESPGGDEIKYQWYRSYSAYRNTGEPILGATTSSYTPEEEIGQVFYFVGVWCVRGRDTSVPIYTTPVAIVYTEAPPAPSAAPTPLPVPSPSGVSGSGESGIFISHGSAILLVIAAVLLLTALAVAVTLLILRSIGKKQRGYDDGYDEDYEEESN